MNPCDNQDRSQEIHQVPSEATLSVNSAYIPNNPDFHPSKDVPQARGCANMIDVIGEN
jgi:hypothetical protein